MKLIGDRVFYKRVAVIALPIVIQNAFTFMVNFVDNIMVGQLGTEAMSGVAIVNQLIYVFNTCILGIIAGASIFGAQFYGNRDEGGLKETFCFRLMACLGLAALAIVIFLTFGGQLILLFLHSENQAEVLETLSFGRKYLTILLTGLIPSALTQAYASASKDMGETFLPMCASVTAVVLNIILNYLLIFGKCGFPAMGVAGAAAATVIARFVECGMMIAVSHRKRERYRFTAVSLKEFRVSPELVKKIAVKGSPLMINEAFWSIGTVLLVQCYSMRGISVIAGVNIATTINSMFGVLYIAVGSSVAIVIGQLLGAGEMEEARDTDNKLLFLAVASSLVVAGMMAAAAPFFPGLYNTSEEVRRLARDFMYVLVLHVPISAFIHAAFFTIRAGGKTMITFLFDSSVLWLVSIPLAFFLTRFTDMDIVLIYFLCQMSELIKCVIGFVLIKKGVWLNKIVPD